MLGQRKGQLPKVIDISLNAIDNNSWTAFGGPLPPVDLQIICEPQYGIEKLSQSIHQYLNDNKTALHQINERKKTLQARHFALRKAQKKATETDWNASPIRVERLIHEVYQAVKNKAWVLTAANHRSFNEVLWDFPGAGAYLGTDGGGGVGYNASAAIGAALAIKAQNKLCVSIGGDGDYLMAPGCIWTAAHYKIPMLHIINNNSTWGNDEVHQIEVAHNRDRPKENAWIGQAMKNPKINFADVASGFGAWTEGPIDDPTKLSATLNRAVMEVEKGNVAVLDVTTSLGQSS